jgi:hypothetical protein
LENFASINPYTEESLAQYDYTYSLALEEKLNTVHTHFEIWKKKSFTERGEFFLKLSFLLKRDADKLAELASIEMGKLLHEAKAEVLKSVAACDFYATQSEQILKSHKTEIDSNNSIEIQFQPLGTVLGIFPWNFPYWQILRSVIPILMSGNTMLVKPAPNVPQCSIALQELINEAGLGDYIATIFANNSQIENLIADERIKADLPVDISHQIVLKLLDNLYKYVNNKIREGSSASFEFFDKPLRFVVRSEGEGMVIFVGREKPLREVRDRRYGGRKSTRKHRKSKRKTYRILPRVEGS